MLKNILLAFGLLSTTIILKNCMMHPECSPWDPTRCCCDDMTDDDYAPE